MNNNNQCQFDVEIMTISRRVFWSKAGVLREMTSISPSTPDFGVYIYIMLLNIWSGSLPTDMPPDGRPWINATLH